jgi:hypothetical protein
MAKSFTEWQVIANEFLNSDLDEVVFCQLTKANWVLFSNLQQ